MLPLDIKLFNKYLTLKGLSDKTIKEYLLYALRFQRFGGFNNEIISHFLLDKPNQNNVARAFINILKEYLIYNRKELGITEEEFKEIIEAKAPMISGRTKKRINIPFTKEEMKLLEDTLPTEELKIMFLTCYNAGLRLQELIRIKISSFNWDKLKTDDSEMGEVKVLGKGNKERIAFIPRWLMIRIRSFIGDGSRYKHGFESSLFKTSGEMFERRLKEAGLVSGITRRDSEGLIIESTRVHPHKLRHQLGYDLTKAGVDIRFTKDILGHSSIVSTQIYTQLSKEDLKDKLRSVQN